MNKKVVRILVGPAIEQTTRDYLIEIFEDKEVVFVNYEDYRRDRIITRHIDIAVVDGTKDISPDFYSEITGKYTRFDNEQDHADYNVLYAGRSKGAFLLGFERGAHMVTATAGGSIIQHVENHTSPHAIEIPKFGVSLDAPSSHHQMMYPYELAEHQYEVLAHSRYFQSETYLNGRNEEWELDKSFLEPEIVYYNNVKGLAIQGHPQKTGTNGGYKSVMRDFITEYFEKRTEQRLKVANRLITYRG